MKYIILTKGQRAIVDDECYEELNKHKWYCSTSRYANRHPHSTNGVRIGKIMMHRVIMNTPKNKQTDHINGDTLDNRRANLRVVTQSQNLWNVKVKGITWTISGYQVRIQKQGKRIFIGYYKTEKEAITARKAAEKKYYGNYRRMEEHTPSV